MSDLLPLVAAALNDKVAFEAHEELVELRKQLELSRSVEIIRAADDENEEVVVYASAQFQDGKYSDNPNLWQVDLERRGEMNCRLADLRDCRICVGGGFPLDSLDDQLDNRAIYEGFLDPDGIDSDNAKAVRFCFCPNALWLTVVVHGWPREAWEAVIETDPEDVIRFLVETVAAQYPETTVEFKAVSFVVGTIQGALKRLLPPKRKEEVRAERDERDAEDSRAHSDLSDFVAMTMRDLGNQSGSAIFIPQVDEVMSLLFLLDVHERNDDTEPVITALIAAHDQIGRDRVEEVIARQLAEANDGEEGDGEG